MSSVQLDGCIRDLLLEVRQQFLIASRGGMGVRRLTGNQECQRAWEAEWIAFRHARGSRMVI